MVRSRQARGLTQAQAREAVAAAGTEIAQSVYAQYEAGTKPVSRTHMPALVEFWGPPPEDEGSPDLAGALSELAAEIRASREERAAMEAKVAVLELAVDALVGRAIGEEPAPAPPRESAGSGRP